MSNKYFFLLCILNKYLYKYLSVQLKQKSPLKFCHLPALNSFGLLASICMSQPENWFSTHHHLDGLRSNL